MHSLAAFWIFAALTLSAIASVIPLQNMQRDPDTVNGATISPLFDRVARTPRIRDFVPRQDSPPLIWTFDTLESSIIKPGSELASLTTEYCTLEGSEGLFKEIISARMNAYDEITPKHETFLPGANRAIFRDPNNDNQPITVDQLSALLASVFNQTIIPVAEHIHQVCPDDSFASEKMESVLSAFIGLLRSIRAAAVPPSQYDVVIDKYTTYLEKVSQSLVASQRRFFMADRGAASIQSAIRRST